VCVFACEWATIIWDGLQASLVRIFLHRRKTAMSFGPMAGRFQYNKAVAKAEREQEHNHITHPWTLEGLSPAWA
jgi:phosphoenolpyruvate carboxylase